MALTHCTNMDYLAEDAGVNRKTLETFIRPSSEVMTSGCLFNLREHLNAVLHNHLSRTSARHLMNEFEIAVTALIKYKTIRIKGPNA